MNYYNIFYFLKKKKKKLTVFEFPFKSCKYSNAVSNNFSGIAFPE